MQEKSFNSLRPKAQRINQRPNMLVRLPPSDHQALLAANLVFIFGILFKFTAPRLFLYIQPETINLVLFLAVLLYLFLSLGFESPILSLIQIRKWKDFKGFCARQRQGNTYFHVSIRCSHQNDSLVHQALQLKQMVDSHYAQATLVPSVIEDLDEKTENQSPPSSPYVFVTFSTTFDYINETSQTKLMQFCNAFVEANRRDAKQEFACKLEIKGLEEKASFYKEESGRTMDTCLAVLALLTGCVYPWACWFSKKITWYELSLCKRVAL